MGKIRFRGFFQHTLDDRNRLAIPSRFRNILLKESRGKVVLTPGYDYEIAVYPLSTWEKFEESELLTLSMDYLQSRRYRRHFTFGIKEDQLDVQGRILIPDFLLQHSNIKKNVIIVGEIDYIELWSPENYEKFVNEINKFYAQDSENIERLRRRKDENPGR
ncbi:division/cell wall cluster transcriptional repressor MraZ [candidate division WOR-3 bacterium 4484_100]|uniref:Transcriptional regulator MraZ n=1 Tax=candidate division WOR-3 bacterium 4484_100 TaxID=1936077 RepID=A0A1V4QGH4_UNCW3|nr:MAG: division/cell wall cluster transcriptional repressor MraZ [candidate division WOR-3 bacterium 4484_100]